ncbi:hypothetical protein JCM10449v2_005259 [Rhodotorula kratochvilovae]
MSASNHLDSPAPDSGQSNSTAPESAFTLIASDGKRHHIDSALLASASKVFADMLNTACENGGPKQCDMTENSEAVATFVAAIKEQTVPATQEDWFGLYCMMDKYDAKGVKSVLLVRGWMANKDDPLYAYGAGALLDDQALMQSAADGCLDTGLINRNDAKNVLLKSSPELAQLRLERSQFARRDALREALTQNPLNPTWDCSCLGWPRDPREAVNGDSHVWNECATLILYRMPSDAVEAMKKEF